MSDVDHRLFPTRRDCPASNVHAGNVYPRIGSQGPPLLTLTTRSDFGKQHRHWQLCSHLRNVTFPDNLGFDYASYRNIIIPYSRPMLPPTHSELPYKIRETSQAKV
jgi:hypothetical protein